MMDNATFKATKTDQNGGWDNALEAYRFAFLQYLDAAKALIELRKKAEFVDYLREIIDDGWSLDDPGFGAMEEWVVEAVKVLYYGYDVENSQSGYKRAIQQFLADLSIAEMRESAMWEVLLGAIFDVDTDKDCIDSDEWDNVWYYDDPAEQHALMLDEEFAHDRICHYEVELKKLGSRPLPPYKQEMMFCFNSFGLTTVSPFTVR